MKNKIELKDRIKYLDIAKFIGIFCIYLGHFGSQAGNAFSFVFCFHVPLFFFLSGCSEALSSDISWKEYIVKNVKRILLPFLFFSIISLLFQCIVYNSHNEIFPTFINIIKGSIRNQFFAGSLWFLTCLFVMKIFFCFIRKIFKNKILILFICLGLFFVAELVINPRPIVTPHMIFNIDSACYYIIFYALGYYGWNLIKKILLWDCLYKKIISIIVGIASFGYTVLLFFGKNILSYFNSISILNLVANILCPIIVIIFIILISKLLENIKLFSDIGKNTLYLCGSEYVIKLLVPTCIQIVGLNISLPNALAAYIYTFILLIICNKILVPIEKNILKKLHII